MYQIGGQVWRKRRPGAQQGLIWRNINKSNTCLLNMLSVCVRIKGIGPKESETYSWLNSLYPILSLFYNIWSNNFKQCYWKSKGGVFGRFLVQDLPCSRRLNFSPLFFRGLWLSFRPLPFCFSFYVGKLVCTITEPSFFYLSSCQWKWISPLSSEIGMTEGVKKSRGET